MARPLGSLSQSIADAFFRRPQTAEDHRHHGGPPDESDYLLLGQSPGEARQPSHTQAPTRTHESHAGNGDPPRTEVLNYLGQLAKEYHLPPKLVYAVADAESGIGPKLENHNPPVKDKEGKSCSSRQHGLRTHADQR